MNTVARSSDAGLSLAALGRLGGAVERAERERPATRAGAGLASAEEEKGTSREEEMGTSRKSCHALRRSTTVTDILDVPFSKSAGYASLPYVVNVLTGIGIAVPSPQDQLPVFVSEAGPFRPAPAHVEAVRSLGLVVD